MWSKKLSILAILLLSAEISFPQRSFVCDPKSKKEREKYDSIIQIALTLFEKSNYNSIKSKQEVNDILVEIVEKGKNDLPKISNLSTLYSTSLDLKLIFEATYLASLHSCGDTTKSTALNKGILRLLNLYTIDKTIPRNSFVEELHKLYGTKELDKYIEQNFSQQ